MSDIFGGGKPPVINKPIKQAKKYSIVMINVSVFSVLLLLFAGFILFVGKFDIKGGAFSKALSVSTMLLIAVSCLLHINGFTFGDKKAEKSDTAVNTDNIYSAHIERIQGEKVGYKVENYCSWYKKDELKRKRTEILYSADFCESDINAIVSGELTDFSKFDKKQLKAIKRAKRLKPVSLNKNMLIETSYKGAERNPIISAGAINAEIGVKFLIKFLSTILSSAFVISISIDIITDFSLIVVISAIMQFTILLWSIFSGIIFGYNSRIKKVVRKQSINNFLNGFWEWVSLNLDNVHS